MYNHPGDIASVGNTLVVAAQNWAGSFCRLNRFGSTVPADAVLFYDISNPEQPQYQGKIPIPRIAPQLTELSNLSLFKCGEYYYMFLGDGSREAWFYSSEVSMDPAKWTAIPQPVVQSGHYRSRTVISVKEEGFTEPRNWMLRMGTDYYWASRLVPSNNGRALTVGFERRQYDVDELHIQAKQAEHGVYVSPSGRMTKITGEAGFADSDDVFDLEAHSIHYGPGKVLWPPDTVLNLSDAGGWNRPEYYATIQADDVTADRYAEILGRSAAGLKIWQHNGTEFLLRDTLGALSDANLGGHPSVYQTIQTCDLDGDGRREIIARTPAGIRAWRFFAGFKQLPGSIPWSGAAGWGALKYFRTIQTADVDGDSKDEILGRAAGGLQVWRHDGSRFVRVNAQPGFLSDAVGWGAPQYYETIQTADILGDGKAELLARSKFGLRAWKFERNQWVALPGLAPLSDATGWDHPSVYSTIQTADLDGDGRAELLARSSFGLAVWRYRNSDFRPMPGGPLAAMANSEGFINEGYYGTIQTADLDGDGKAEVLARFFTGVRAFQHTGSGWQPLSKRIRYLGGEYGGARLPGYYRTIQTADFNGDGRSELLARVPAGLIHYTSEELGVGRALHPGARHYGTATKNCDDSVPGAHINGRPTAGRTDFHYYASNVAPFTPGYFVLGVARSAGTGIPILGANVLVDVFNPASLILPVPGNRLGWRVQPLPLLGPKGLRFYSQFAWLQNQPCGRSLSATRGLEIVLQ